MLRLLAGALGALLAAPALAAGFAPGGNSGALARPFTLPTLGGWAVRAAGEGPTDLLVDVTNEYVREGDCAVECLVLDGETTRVRLIRQRGLGGGWDLGIEVPFLDEGGGFLDGWIQDWHGWFGLPNGGREQTPDDRYRYRYERAGVAVLDRTEPGDGLGDVTVTLGRALGARGALRTAVTFPTGDDSLLGAGNTGGALWLDLGLPVPHGWDGYLSAGLSRNERGDLLPAQQNDTVYFGGVGLLMPFIAGTRLQLQVQGHTRLYDDSALRALERPGVPLTVGLQFPTGDGGAIELGFLEDLSVAASPDFVAYLRFSSGR